jgi:hypothetical protein
MVSPPRVKPKLRGVFHEFGFYASIAGKASGTGVLRP